MKIELNKRRGMNEKQTKKTIDQDKNGKIKWCHICDKDTHDTKQCFFLPQNNPNKPHYKGKREEGNKNVNYQATEDDIPPIHCPRCMTWGHDAKNCPHKDFKGAVCMHCGLGDHKTMNCPRNGRPSNLFSRTSDNEENYDINACTRFKKKTNTKPIDTDFSNLEKEKDRFIVAKEAQAKREAVKKA
eukprot:Gb_29667 [translate_table: standard]